MELGDENGVKAKQASAQNSPLRRAMSSSDRVPNASSVGAKRVKAPVCFSSSIKPAVSISDKNILEARGKLAH